MEQEINDLKYPWYKIWFYGIFRPSVDMYESLLRDKNATRNRAFIWMGVVGIIVGIGTAVSSQVPHIESNLINRIICYLPLGPVLTVGSLILFAGLINFLARKLGGSGSFDKLAYSFATFYAPILVINAFLGFIPFGPWIRILTAIYNSILSVIAVKAVHQFEWKKAVIASMPDILAAILFIIRNPTLIGLS